ncbi:hypothetical protein [Pontibacillus yanchengensis]|uniref:hypothetical protein n=1 Tax=Pontibacillus yanchengensis TaxID=462910 RepID=UPI000AC7C12D|nr:hypothetical protein [Pontibacillus yanchengensis]
MKKIIMLATAILLSIGLTFAQDNKDIQVNDSYAKVSDNQIELMYDPNITVVG